MTIRATAGGSTRWTRRGREPGALAGHAAGEARGQLTVSGTVRLLQLASPALPIGGYSYSTGLESAIEFRQVIDPATAFDWINDAMALVIGRFDAPLLVAAWQACVAGDGQELARLNCLALAARETAEFRLESEQMGYSLTQWILQVPAQGSLPLPADLPVAVTIAWAMAAWKLQLDAPAAVTGYLWSFAENQVMVLIKTLPLGQIQAQRVLHRLGASIDEVALAAVSLPPQQWSNAAPGLAIASMRHETQYSRLFRS
jgi:urease accessory protein